MLGDLLQRRYHVIHNFPEINTCNRKDNEGNSAGSILYFTNYIIRNIVLIINIMSDYLLSIAEAFYKAPLFRMSELSARGSIWGYWV